MKIVPVVIPLARKIATTRSRCEWKLAPVSIQTMATGRIKFGDIEQEVAIKVDSPSNDK
jgi:hypothetical protein